MMDFRLTISDDMVRTLTKQQYKDATHWLRTSARVIRRPVMMMTMPPERDGKSCGGHTVPSGLARLERTVVSMFQGAV